MFDLRQIPYCAVSDASDAAQRNTDLGAELTECRGECGLGIHVFKNENARRRRLRHVLPKIHAMVITMMSRGSVEGANAGGDGVAHHRGQQRRKTFEEDVREPFIAKPDVELLDRVGDSTGIQRP